MPTNKFEKSVKILLEDGADFELTRDFWDLWNFLPESASTREFEVDHFPSPGSARGPSMYCYWPLRGTRQLCISRTRDTPTTTVWLVELFEPGKLIHSPIRHKRFTYAMAQLVARELEFDNSWLAGYGSLLPKEPI